MKNHLAPGEYYIGDPCYVIDHEKWDEFCGELWDAQKRRRTIFTFDNYDVAVMQTEWGDGQYESSEGIDLGVDAGIIGAIPMELITRGDPYDDGMVVTFNDAFECSNKNGTLWFGAVWVETNPEDNENECPYCGGECCR